MKKTAIILTVILLLSCLVGCDTPPVDGGQLITAPSGETADGPAFVWAEVSLRPGAPFDPNALPAAESVYQVPSCAQQGTDNVYNYGSFELTAYNNGSGEVIYSIYICEPSVKTAEGIALSDNISKAITAYGSNYTQAGTGYTFTFDDVLLIFVTQNDTIISIEYRMNTP